MKLQLKEPALHVGLVTDNGERMLDFYTRVLGLKLVAEVGLPDLGVVHKLRCGHSVLKLLVLDQPAASANPGGGFSHATGYRYLCMNIINIDEVVHACREDGRVISVEIKEIRSGVKAAMIEDPDNNAIELMQMD